MEPKPNQDKSGEDLWAGLVFALLAVLFMCGARFAFTHKIIPTTLDGNEAKIPQSYDQGASKSHPSRSQGSYLNPAMMSIPSSGFSAAP